MSGGNMRMRSDVDMARILVMMTGSVLVLYFTFGTK